MGSFFWNLVKIGKHNNFFKSPLYPLPGILTEDTRKYSQETIPNFTLNKAIEAIMVSLEMYRKSLFQLLTCPVLSISFRYNII